MGEEKRDRSLLLSGLMGSGKTTVGRLLADRLRRRFIDTDDRIEAASGLSIAEIFACHGEGGFRKRESDVLRDLPKHGAVVALGGGTVIDPENRTLLRKKGLLVWLDAPPEALAARLGTADDRPLLAGLDADARAERLRGLYDARAEAYADCDVRVPIEGLEFDQVANRVLEVLGWGDEA